MSSRVHVAVGVIYNKEKDKVLISRRTEKQHLAGLWEFPGGKVEDDENILSALNRELYEELGISNCNITKLHNIYHDYPDKKVLLDVWSVSEWDGQINARENQEIAWVPISDLSNYTFPEANRHIVSSILLPDVYLISKDFYQDKTELLSVLEDCFSVGLKIFQLRLNQTSEMFDLALIKQLKKITKQYNASLIINGTPDMHKEYDTDGLHLSFQEASKYHNRPINNKKILGVSCHNEDEIKQAERIAADYIFLSPIYETKSHPNAKAIGWDKFEECVKKTNIPVFALGGLSPEDGSIARTMGVQGIAMISSVWESDTPNRVIQSCIEFSAYEQCQDNQYYHNL